MSLAVENIKCILCGLDTDRNNNLINHMTDEHRIVQEVHFVLAGCFIQKGEREDISDIFWEFIASLVTPKLEIEEDSKEILLKDLDMKYDIKTKANEENDVSKSVIKSYANDIIYPPRQEYENVAMSKEPLNVNSDIPCEVYNLTFSSKKVFMRHTKKFHSSIKILSKVLNQS